MTPSGYHTVRVAIDPLGGAISGRIDCKSHPRCDRSQVVEVGPFDTPGEVFQRCCELLDSQLRLW